MKNIYYVWVDLNINDILAIKKNEVTEVFLEQLQKENIQFISISANSTLDAIQKYKNRNNIHSNLFLEPTGQKTLH